MAAIIVAIAAIAGRPVSGSGSK